LDTGNSSFSHICIKLIKNAWNVPNWWRFNFHSQMTKRNWKPVRHNSLIATLHFNWTPQFTNWRSGNTSTVDKPRETERVNTSSTGAVCPVSIRQYLLHDRHFSGVWGLLLKLDTRGRWRVESSYFIGLLLCIPPWAAILSGHDEAQTNIRGIDNNLAQE